MQIMKLLGLLALAGLLAVVALILFNVTPKIGQVGLEPIITTFEECAAAGNPVMESYPRQCRSKDGRIFVEEVEFPVSGDVDFDEGMVANGCAVAGCSGQLCVAAIEAENIMTTCEYLAEYACYKEASCEPQANGECGWTKTDQLKQCLANPPALDSDLDANPQ